MRRIRSNSIARSVPVIAGLIAGMLVAILAIPLCAQPGDESRPAQGIGPVYDAAHEITLSGTIESVVTKHTPGSPVGMHLLIAAENGTVDAHVGPFLGKDVQEALHSGLPVHIVGAMQEIRGKQYLLVRQLSFGGRTITVRSEHGLLAGPTHRAREASLRTSQTEPNGGAR